MGDLVRLLEAMRVGMFAAMIGIVAISAAGVVASISEGDSGSAWVWAVVFMVASILDAWAFSGLV